MDLNRLLFSIVPAVLLLVACGGSAEPAPSTAVRHEIMPTKNHVSEGTAVEYNSVPPTSGDHWPRWSQCGFFEEELPDERLVHNLEHGNIIVSYNLADENSVDELRAAMDGIKRSSNWGVTRAYSKIPEGTVALTAWGVSDTMDGIQPDRIRRFFDSYAGELGPERVSCHDSGVMPQAQDLHQGRTSPTAPQGLLILGLQAVRR